MKLISKRLIATLTLACLCTILALAVMGKVSEPASTEEPAMLSQRGDIARQIAPVATVLSVVDNRVFTNTGEEVVNVTVLRCSSWQDGPQQCHVIIHEHQ